MTVALWSRRDGWRGAVLGAGTAFPPRRAAAATPAPHIEAGGVDDRATGRVAPVAV